MIILEFDSLKQLFGFFINLIIVLSDHLIWQN
jgi:hypothetical protein